MTYNIITFHSLFNFVFSNHSPQSKPNRLFTVKIHSLLKLIQIPDLKSEKLIMAVMCDTDALVLTILFFRKKKLPDNRVYTYDFRITSRLYWGMIWFYSDMGKSHAFLGHPQGNSKHPVVFA